MSPCALNILYTQFKGSQCYLSYIFVCRVVKRSSYRLNLLILVGVCIGFSGTILHVIVLDDNMPELFTTTVCNVSGLQLRLPIMSFYIG